VETEDLLDHGRRIAALERQVAELSRRLGGAEPVAAQGFRIAADAPASVTAADDPQIAQKLAAGDKIGAIKLYRELTGSGLAEAKDAVERIETGQ
jgi:ribosomal protein L7/L12